MNKIIKNTLILAAITVVSGLVLGAAYEVTKGPIAQTQAKQKQEACQAVYPEADSFEAMDVDQKAAKEAIKKMGTNATVDEVYSAVMDGSEAGYVITVTDKDGYGGDIQITVGIMSDVDCGCCNRQCRTHTKHHNKGRVFFYKTVIKSFCTFIHFHYLLTLSGNIQVLC